MGFNLDLKELQSFSKSMNKVSKDFEKLLRQVLIRSAQEVIAKTKLRTPVDTGALRRSWVLGQVKGYGSMLYVDILNGMDYATDVEYGHRIVKDGVEVGWVNGRFMLKISIDEVRKRLPREYDGSLKSYCEARGLRYD